MAMSATYLHLVPEQRLPDLPGTEPFRAVVILDAAPSSTWRHTVSKWLVDAHCLYAVVCGKNSAEWDDAIDFANIEKFNFERIPDRGVVMTTWHDSEPLAEAFWFAKNNAHHQTVTLSRTLLVHVSAAPAEASVLRAFTEA